MKTKMCFIKTIEVTSLIKSTYKLEDNQCTNNGKDYYNKNNKNNKHHVNDCHHPNLNISQNEENEKEVKRYSVATAKTSSVS